MERRREIVRSLLNKAGTLSEYSMGIRVLYSSISSVVYIRIPFMNQMKGQKEESFGSLN